MLSSILVSGAVGVVFFLGVILASPNMADTIAEGQAGGFPIATIVTSTLTFEILPGITFGEIYLLVILASVFVCTMAIQGAASRLMFSMGRDRHLPGGRVWGHVQPRFKTPANAAVAVGIIAALPILLSGPYNAYVLSIMATGLIYLSYFLCNLGVFLARRKGWPTKAAWFKLGGWGTTINVIALVYGAVMLINIALWHNDAFGDWGTAGRDWWNPLVNSFLTFLGNPIEWLPGWPLFETMVGLFLILCAIYYFVSVRGRPHDVEAAAAATDEAMI